MLERLRSDLAWLDARGTDGMDPRTAQVFRAARAFVARSIEAHTGERPAEVEEQQPADQLRADQLRAD
jgi:hypothetical protein